MQSQIRKLLMLVLVLGLFAALPTFSGAAQEEARAPQHFTLLAGTEGVEGISNNFAPRNIQVHKGDTVSWLILGPHNVHFTQGDWLPMVVVPEVDGQPTPILNPEIIIPTIEFGGVYTGGEVNTGLAMGGDSMSVSLVIDAEVGTYRYLCDIHAGMTGTIEVVADDVEILSPSQVIEQAFMEYFGAAMAVSENAHAAHSTLAANEVQVGAFESNVFYNEYLPSVKVIKAGESITWNVPVNSNEPVSVTSLDLVDGGLMPLFINGEDAPPVLALTPGWNRLTEDGSEIAQGQSFNSGALEAGSSYTLTFVEPGVYEYGAFIGMMKTGTVVVLPN